MSSYEQWDRGLIDSLAREFTHGTATLHTGEYGEGIRQFGAGERDHARLIPAATTSTGQGWS